MVSKHKVFIKSFLPVFIIIFLAFQNSVLAIHPTIRNYNRKTSNIGTQNWEIIQHKNDWMYFANNKGLVEFDGNRWTIFPIKNYTNVRSLYYDEQTDRIYAGAFNEFGYYARNDRGLLEYHSLINKVKSNERDFNEIWHINKIDNVFYFQGDRVIFQYKGNEITRFSFKSKIEYSAVVHNSLIVSSISDGVKILNGNLFMNFPTAEILKNKKVCAILPFDQTKILFVTDFFGLFLFDGEKVETYPTDLDLFMSQNQVFCATINDSKLALGTVRNGLVVKDLNDNSNLFSNTFSGLQNNTILSMHFDHQNNLWLGLDKGIDYVLLNSPIYDLFGNNQMFGSGYCSLIKGNTLYLGTNQGLYITQYPIQNQPNPQKVNLVPHMQGQIWSLWTFDNLIFCGTDHGAYIIEGSKIEQFAKVPGTWAFRELSTKPDCILGSSYQGFFILKKVNKKWIFSNFVKGFDESGEMFEEDIDGRIWFSHWIKGVSRLTLNENMDSIIKIEKYGQEKGFPSNSGNSIYKINNEIIFPTQNGFFSFNHKTDKIEKSVNFDKLFGHPVQSTKLTETKQGDIWCTSFPYIALAKIQSDKSYKVDTVSFCPLKKKIITGFENLNTINDKNTIVSTEDGFSWLDLTKVTTAKNHFKITIRNIYFPNFNDSIISGYIGTQNIENIPTFAFKYNSIRFEYVATEYRNETPVTYSYFLENFDSEWSAYTPENSKEYTKLSKRKYTFRVRAKNLLETTPVETSYEFRILPPWYESIYALIVYFIILILMILKLLAFIKSQSEKGALEMKAKKEKEMQAQEIRYQEDAKEKKKEIVELKNQRLQYDLRHKSQELANSTMNLIRKNEILLDINKNLSKICDGISEKAESKIIMKKLQTMQDDIKKNIEQDNNWKRFADNFDLVYENYLKRLSEDYPDLTISDKKLCAYLKMDLSSKDIAPLLNMSFRSVEMSRHRLRKKMDLNRDVNLSDFLQKY